MDFDRKLFESLLGQVERPGRYLGNERGAVRKDLEGVRLRFALAFPEVYEIAQSHPGLQILYDILNRRPEVYAERVYAPWIDMEALLRRKGQPLVSLETFTPLNRFDIVGFSLQYELTYTNVITMLELGGVPIHASDRGPRDPVIIAGGPCAFNPEPLADFLDAILLGDGEEAVYDICDVHLQWDGRDRGELLAALASVPGVYVPSLFTPAHAAAGGPVDGRQPPLVEKRVLRDLDSVPMQATYVVPNLKVIHARPSLEVMRGCVKGCRFCQAGYVYRPLRERNPHRVLAQAEQAVAVTGTDELSLLSLSTGDYSCVNPVLTALMNRFAGERIAVSLPSTRVDALAPALLEQIRRVRKTGFTLAPEAGSQRLRDLIQKEYDEDELLDAARKIFALGWRSLKLYFMLGLPGETEEDLIGIAELSAKVKALAPRGAEVTASVSNFVPKPHTPFQWAAQIDVTEIERRQALLRHELRRRGIRFKWHDARASHLEGIISRGDRHIGRLLLAAQRLGCRFDGWTDTFRFELWEQALAEAGIDSGAYLRRRLLDEPLPWDHIGSGVSKKFLQRELARAVEGRLTPDCSVERCTYCGACDFKSVRNIDYHIEGAKGAEHRGGEVDAWARQTAGSADAPGSWEPRGWHKIRQRVIRPRPSIATHSAATLGPVRGPEPTADPGATGRPAANSASLAAGNGQPAGLNNAEEWLTAEDRGRMPLPPSEARPPRMRIRFTYRKLGRARFISHLELIDVFSSAFRRAALPVAYSQGHRPMPRLRFGPGLPVGIESDCEVLDVDLTTLLAPDDAARALDRQLPEGMSIAAAEMISLRSPAVEADMTGVRYRVAIGALINGHNTARFDQRIAAFMQSSSFVMRKRTGRGERWFEARPLVARLQRVDAAHVELDLRFTRDGSVKPVDLLAALLELDAASARALPIRKTHWFRARNSPPIGSVAPAPA